MKSLSNIKQVSKALDIVIIADFCDSFDGNDNNRFIYIAKQLCDCHNIEIVTSDFNHRLKSYFPEKIKGFPYKITMLHEGKYKRNVCISRFFAHYLWGRNVKKYLKTRKIPDIIYCAVPTLTTAFYAAKYCENNLTKFIVDVQDLWPEAFQMFFNIAFISKVLFAPFKILENAIYKRADEIIAVSQTYVDRAMEVNKKCTVGHSIFLGTDLSTFDTNVSNTRDTVLRKYLGEKKSEDLWISYCGTLGNSYDLNCVIDSLKLLNNLGYHGIKFIIMGDGPKKKEFEKYANDKNVNAYFMGRVPYSEMCGILSRCDAVVNPIMCGSTQSIINKHADYAAAGIPVINTQECVEYCDLVEYYNMGFNCKNGNSKELAEKILLILKNPEIRRTMGSNARKCAEERFDRRHTYKEIREIIRLEKN